MNKLALTFIISLLLFTSCSKSDDFKTMKRECNKDDLGRCIPEKTDDLTRNIVKPTKMRDLIHKPLKKK